MTGTEQRYTRATRSSHLKTEDAPGDIDHIIAAGLAEPLGVLLVRLRGEWDTISQREIALAGNSLTARVLILMNLRSLDDVKRSLIGFAQRQAPHKGCNSSPAAIGKLVGQVIDVWLDKLCHHCDGRGFSGMYDGPRLMCNKCGGTGSRRASRLGADDAEAVFGAWLLNVMDSRPTGSMRQVQQKTRNDEHVSEPREAESAAIKKRIAELKSAEAEAD